VFGAPVEKPLIACGGHAKLQAPEEFWKAVQISAGRVDPAGNLIELIHPAG